MKRKKTLNVGRIKAGYWLLTLLLLLTSVVVHAQQTGHINPYVITERFSTNVAGYFPTERLQTARSFYEIYDSTYDATPATAPLATLLGYAEGSNQGEIYVPTSYIADKPVGFFIYINSDDSAGFLNIYAQAFNDLYIIGAAPQNVGNNQPDILRISHSLDMMKTVMATYNIDPDRIYIGGHSGGAATASYTSLMYPELFKGVVCNVRSLTTVEHDYFTMAEVVDVAQQYQQRISLSTGPNDFNYQHVLNSAPLWRYHGFPVRLFDVPGMGHVRASLATFTASLGWVDYPYSSRTANTFTGWSFYQTDELEQIFFMPDGDNDLDKIINRDEYIFATDPFDSLSKPEGIQISVSNGMQLSYVCRASLADYEIDIGVSTNLNSWDYSNVHLEDLGYSAEVAGGIKRNYSPKEHEIGDSAFFKLRIHAVTNEPAFD